MKRTGFLMSIGLFFVILFFVAEYALAVAEKTIELKFASFLPPTHHEHIQAFVPFTQAVEERTKGRVKLTIYPGGTLCKARDLYDCALQGISETAYFIQSYTAGRFPLTSVMELPLGVPNAKIGTKMILELYQKYLKSEYPGVKLLSIWTNESAHLFTTKRPIKNLEDIKGLRIRSPGPVQTKLLEELGASPISMPASDLYDALQRGMVDGMLTDFPALKGFRFHEVVEYCTILNASLFPMAYAVNIKVWNSLPPDIQYTFEELAGWFSEENGKSFYKNDRVGRELSKGKITIHQLIPEQQRIFAEKFKQLINRWIADMEAKGLPGKRVYQEAVSLLNKYSK